MKYLRRLTNSFALIGAASCARPVAKPPAQPAAKGVRESDIETLELNIVSDPYHWTRAQRDSAMAVLATNRAKWAAYRPRTYEYWERGWCFCFLRWPGPHLLVIRNQRLVSATDTSRQKVDSAYVKAVGSKVAGIDALFSQLAVGIRDTSIAEVRVSYDAAHGYPVDITYDRALMVADDEFYVQVKHLRAIP
jgi:hypothetical protein